MTDTTINTRILIRRELGSEVPTELRFGELFFLDGTNELYIGKSDGTVFLINATSQQTGETSLTYVGVAPPTDPNKFFWIQITEDGQLIEQWQRAEGDIWVGREARSVEAFLFEIKGNKSWPLANPLQGDLFWVERLTAKAWVQDNMGDNDYVDFQLKLVNTSQEKVLFHYLRMEGKSPGDVFNGSEAIGEVVTLENAIAFWLQVQRQGQTKLKTMSMALTVRRAYAASN